MTYRDTYTQWMEHVKDQVLLSELETITDDDSQIKERFLGNLPFGTAGLRGVIGAGTMRMNIYTVGKATQGLSDYINENGDPKKGMAIAYDSRQFSKEFAREAAQIFAGNGIKVFLFEELTSVPELSFAVRHLNAFGGIVITASHNPKDYNGYKVYASYGGQLDPEASLQVTNYIQEVDVFQGIKKMDFDQAVSAGMIQMIGEEIDQAYYQKMIALCGTVPGGESDLEVVYTPLHGTGLRTVQNVFAASGIKNLHIVAEQSTPDGRFPTVSSPNPEDPSAMKMAIALAKKVGAGLAIGTDPDADRLGAAIKGDDGEYVMLSGNQIACILIYYLLEKQKAELRPDDYIIKSFVSTKMADAIAEHYGIDSYTVSTGFRFISELITEKEKNYSRFIFGFEESHGYLAGDFTRDKDGAMAALLMAHAAIYYAQQGKSLFQVLQGLYAQYGFYTESVKSIVFEGVDGMDTMNGIMDSLRKQQIQSIGGLNVLNTEDYLSGIRMSADGKQSAISLPKTNAMMFLLEHNAWICIRPSGTEPKIKIYFAVCEPDLPSAQKQVTALEKAFVGRINDISQK